MHTHVLKEQRSGEEAEAHLHPRLGRWAQVGRMEAALAAAPAAPLHDLRRHDTYREHTGRLQRKEIKKRPSCESLE